MFLFYLNKYPGIELLNHMVVLFLISGEISILFSVMPAHSQEQRTQASFFPHPHQQLLVLVFLDNGHSDRCEVISHGFNLRFHDDY